jgi:hypothetical protein
MSLKQSLKKYWTKPTRKALDSILIGILFVFVGLGIILLRGFNPVVYVWVPLSKESSYFLGSIVILVGLYTLFWGVKNLIQFLRNKEKL